MGKKRKKEDGSGSGDEREGQRSDDEVDQTQKYQVYNKKGYSRKYPDNSTKTEFVVFLSHDEDNKPFTDKDRMKISLAIRKYCVTGVLHLRTMNRYKVAITFDVPNNANIFIQNAKLLDELGVTASIPAADTEATGVITAVPTEMSNKQIFSLIDSSRNIIQVRRLMRRVRDEGGKVSFQPTQTVAVTFASTQLPEYVYLNHWRHEVSVYVPPVKQCLRCLRFGHIAKFCRNAEVCSICTASHNFRACTVKTEDAKCANCGGNHVAIAAAPMIFAGDFNAYHTSWGCDSTSPRGRDILEVIDDNNLVLLNDGQYTTVGSLTWRQNALDLSIVSPSLALSCEWSVHDDPLGSYHLP